MHFGLDSIIGAAIPAGGDALCFFIGLYQVLISMFFGISFYSVGLMVSFFIIIAGMMKTNYSQLLYILADAFIGIIPFIGDLLDVAFKANIYNLRILEKELKKSRWAPVVCLGSIW